MRRRRHAPVPINQKLRDARATEPGDATNTLHPALWGVVALGAVWACVVAAGTLAWPFGRDQGVFAWVGDVILRGGMPYRDAWEVKGPATHYTYALAQLVFGRGIWAIRALELLMLVGGLYALDALLRTLRCSGVTRTAALVLLSFLHWQAGSWNTAQPDAWAGWLTAAALAVLLPATGAAWRAAAAGALFGLAGLLKPPFVLLAAAGCTLLWLRTRAGESTSRAHSAFPMLAALVAGGVLVAAATAGFFAAMGALDALLDIQLGFNSVHRGQHARSFGDHASALATWLGDLRIAALLGLAAWGFQPALARGRALTLALLVWLATATVLVALQDKHYVYHYALLHPPLVVLAALGIDALLSSASRATRLRLHRVGAVVFASAALALLLWLEAPPPNIRAYSTYVLHTMTRNAYERAGDNPAGGYSFRNTRAAAAELREMTRDDETIFVWGFDPGLYFLAGRAGTSRFGFAYPMIVSGGSAYSERYRSELMADLFRAPPAAFVVAHADANNLLAETSAEHLRAFGRLDRWLRAHYGLAERIGQYRIWLPLEAAPP